MYRLMQPSDEAAVLALWQSQHHDTEDFAKMVLERFAGVQNIYVADENDAIVAAALAVPVTCRDAQAITCACAVRVVCCWQVCWIPCAPSKSCGAQALPWQSRQTQHRLLCCRIKALQRLLPCVACLVR